jgi:hypothetical protein
MLHPERHVSRVVGPGDMRKLKRVLCELERKNLFKSFRKKTGGIPMEERVGFDIKLHCEREVTLYFFTKKNGGSHISTVETMVEYPTAAHYRLIENFTTGDLQNTLEDCLIRYNVGFNIEHNLIRDVLKYLIQDGVAHYGIRYVRNPTVKEDIAGADLFVVMNQGEMPLQLKSSVFGQDQHKKKFPHIPSYVYNSKLSPKETVELLAKIGDHYFRKERVILHC